MLFKKQKDCCASEAKQCPSCGLRFEKEIPERCPRCNAIMPHQGCQGCKHKGKAV